ncbi:MAG: hypothetical protein BGO38_05475 [Cellulomonas sp. 73-145]|nr:MAG: hypothetical protein BGO38_05475 [Cellulomonas sp. 73-145]
MTGGAATSVAGVSVMAHCSAQYGQCVSTDDPRTAVGAVTVDRVAVASAAVDVGGLPLTQITAELSAAPRRR